MAITILQEPLGLTPTNAEHIYSFSSSTASSATNFKFVVDIWFRPNTAPEQVARLKVYPNEYGVGMVDVAEILTNYFKANPRSETPQGAGFNITGGTSYTAATPNGLISNARYISQANAYNEINLYTPYYQMEEYRVLVGEEYDVNGSPVTYIQTDPSIQPSVFSATSSGATFNWFNAAVNQPNWTGTTITYGAYSGSPIFTPPYASGLSYSADGSASVSGNTGDILWITETYSGVKAIFIWNNTGWLAAGYSGLLDDNPYTKLSWPGRQINVVNFNYDKVNEQYWNPNNTDGTYNHLFYEAYKYQFTGSTYQGDNAPALFLNNFGNSYTSIITPQTSSNRVRYRNHHYQCPIVLNLFNKKNYLYTNEASVVQVTKTTGSTMNPSAWETMENYIIDYPPYTNNWYNPKEILTSFTNIYDQYPGYTIAAWVITTGDTRVSEVVQYNLTNSNCLSDPIHFLYLNSNGVWDTLTFDRKNVKTFDFKKQTYAQNTSFNKPLYNRLSTDARNVVYNTDVVESVRAQSDFVYENDRILYEELYMSPEIYLMEQHDEDGVEYEQNTPYLIPIILTSNSVEQYKNKYNKLYQYTIEFNYNAIKPYRTSY